MTNQCKDCDFSNMRWYKGIDWCILRFGKCEPETCSGYSPRWYIKLMNNYPKAILVTLIAISAFALTVCMCRAIPSFSPPESRSVDSQPAGPALTYLQSEFGDEYETIMAAAARNSCSGDNLLILFAVRKAENGGLGIEFGIECRRGTDLNTQAGWAAATIMKNRERWDTTITGDDFIAFLGKRYCPLNHEVWIRNVKFWVNKFKDEQKVRIVE